MSRSHQPHICPGDAQRRDLFRFTRINMRVAAMYPLGLERFLPKWLHKLGSLVDLFYEFYLYFVTIHIWILYVCTFYLFYHESDLEFLVNCLIQILIYFWTILMKIYFRRIQPKRLMSIVKTINYQYEIRSANGFTYVTMDECLVMSKQWIRFYLSFCFTGVIFWLLLPIGYGDQSLPLTCWYPFDYKQPIIYETMYFLQFCAQLQVAAGFSSSSSFFMNVCIAMSGQYDVLCCSLKNVLANAYMRMDLPHQDLIALRTQQEIADAEPSQYYVAVEKPMDLACLEHLSRHEVTAKPDNFRAAFRQSFKECVTHHRFILNAMQQIEDFYSPIWFLKTGEVMFLMCLVCFVSVKSTTANSSFIKILSLGQYLLLVVWEMLIITYFGEVIFLYSQRCGEALLRSPWYLHMREIKQDFLLFLLNSQRPFKLTAGKFSVLNVERFRAIMATAFSFLTLLQKMDNRN